MSERDHMRKIFGSHPPTNTGAGPRPDPFNGMTAQQQLAELIGESTRHYATWTKERLARDFIRDHGQAIAELIEAAQKQVDSAPTEEPIRPESSNYDDVAEWSGEWEEWFSAGPLRIILARLTEPK